MHAVPPRRSAKLVLVMCAWWLAVSKQFYILVFLLVVVADVVSHNRFWSLVGAIVANRTLVATQRHRTTSFDAKVRQSACRSGRYQRINHFVSFKSNNFHWFCCFNLRRHHFDGGGHVELSFAMHFAREHILAFRLHHAKAGRVGRAANRLLMLKRDFVLRQIVNGVLKSFRNKCQFLRINVMHSLIMIDIGFVYLQTTNKINKTNIFVAVHNTQFCATRQFNFSR